MGWLGGDSKSVSPFDLTERDLEWLARSYITPKDALEAGLYRVDTITGSQEVGKKPAATRNFAGIIFPYFHPLTGHQRERILRRDEPDNDNGKEKGKYIGPPGRTNIFYIPVGVKRGWMVDASIPVVFVEGEKKCLAMWRIARENGVDSGPLFIPIGLRGVWGWKGRIGIKELPNGGHEPELGPINDFSFFEWKSREVIILFDSNIHSSNLRTSESVMAARTRLAQHLHFLLDAKVFYSEMTREHFECGINGPDDLAGLEGPRAVLKLLADRRPAFERIKVERERLTPEQRKAQADTLRRAAGKSPDALAADIFGRKAAKHLLRLWAQAGFESEDVHLLIAWEVIAQGRDSVDYSYADLYELLYSTDGTEIEQTNTGGHTLKSSCRKKLSERIARFEARQAEIGITFAYPVPGKLDESHNPVLSHVDLYSRQFIAEIEILAESLPGYARGKKEARNKAVISFISQKSGLEYIRKQPLRKNRSKQIADGLQRVKGNLKATLKRMEDRGDPICEQWLQVMEILPPGLIDFIKQKAIEEYEAGRSGDLIRKKHEVTPQAAEKGRASQLPGPAIAVREGLEAKRGVTLKQATNATESTYHSTCFEKTCTILQLARDRGTLDIELWDRACGRVENGSTNERLFMFESLPRSCKTKRNRGQKQFGMQTVSEALLKKNRIQEDCQ